MKNKLTVRIGCNLAILQKKSDAEIKKILKDEFTHCEKEMYKEVIKRRSK